MVQQNVRRSALGFWAVAFAFLVVMSLATLPSPLYGLYRTRDHLSAFVITVVFAIGGVDQSIRIEMFGDLHEYGALGRVVTKSEALEAI